MMNATPHMVESPSSQRLRAALRLCFPPGQADALAGLARDEPADALARLAPVVRLARLRYTLDRLPDRLRRRRPRPSDAPLLAPRPGLSAAGALGLALRLGLDLDHATLARLLGQSTDELARELLRARWALDPGRPAACAEFAAPLELYGGPALDRVGQLQLLLHLGGCQECRAVLERDRALDARLLAALAEIETAVSPLDAAPPRAGRLLPHPALRWSAVAILALLLGAAAVAGLRPVLLPRQAPVPSQAPARPANPLGGWLLQVGSDGSLQAFDLTSGTRRTLIAAYADAAVDTVLSPDRRRIAQETINGQAPNRGFDLRAYDLNGRLLRDWGNPDQAGSSSAGLAWLDSDTVLLAQVAIGQVDPNDANRDQLPLDAGQLVALHVASGARQILFAHGVQSMAVSPDAKYLALVRIDASGKVGLEIRPFEDQALGDAVVTFPGPAGNFSKPLWTPDSRRVLFTTGDPSRQGEVLESLGLDGTLTELHGQAHDPGLLGLIGITPDGRQVIYVEGGPPGIVTSCWLLPLAGGTPSQLSGGSHCDGPLLASPTGDALALTFEGQAQGNGAATALDASGTIDLPHLLTVALDADGQRLGTLRDRFEAGTPLAWLPSDALPLTLRAPPAPAAGAFGGLSPLVVPGARITLSSDSRLSPDGQALLAGGSGFDVSVALPRSGEPVARSAGPAGDPGWLPDGDGVIGVDQAVAPPGATSRISLFLPQSDTGTIPVEFDPANLGQSTIERYRLPLLSPNGLSLSFFVTGERQVTLWVGGQDRPAAAVLSWTLPADAKVEVPPLAVWISNDELLAAVPESWAGGFPTDVSLRRVTIAPDGSASVERQAGWQTHGREHGIVVRELVLSSDQTRIALRLRHYGESNPDTGQSDALLVLATRDVTQGLELARGVPGDGLSWAPDGTQLVAALRGRLLVLDADGSRVEPVSTGEGAVSYPVWVRPDEIWFMQGTGGDVRVMRVSRARI